MKELRTEVFQRAGCVEPAEELAHLHSKGMGGSKTANRPDNAMAACWLDARITDGHHPAARDETVRMFRLVGYEWDWVGSLAWHRAEALSDWVTKGDTK